MPLDIPLQNIPNQEFNIQINNDLYFIRLRFIINLMTMTVARNTQVLLENVRAMPNSLTGVSYPVIPYAYLQSGNFYFFTQNDEYPIYTQFGINQFLVYLSPTDLAAINARN